MPTSPPWCAETQVAPARRVRERVEHRPVGDGVATITALVSGSATRPSRCRGDRAQSTMGAEMTPQADEESLMARPKRLLAAAEARRDSCRQALEGHALGCQPNPPAQRLACANMSRARAMGRPDVCGGAPARGGPPERSLPLAEQHGVTGHDPGDVERTRLAAGRGLRTGCCCRSRRRPPRHHRHRRTMNRARRSRQGLPQRQRRASVQQEAAGNVSAQEHRAPTSGR